jgi:glucokinase
VQILTGDIGGTNTRLAMLDWQTGSIRVTDNDIFPSAASSSLGEIVAAFCARNPKLQPQAAAFGVAGPVANGISRITNLPWVVSASDLGRQLGLHRVYVLNDLEALAWGIDTLDAEDMVRLQTGSDDATGNRAVIAAGTGLGQAGLFFDGTGHVPFATEGGHEDFSPANEREWRLQGFLQQRFGHVSWERVVSGPGLVNLFEFLLQETGAPHPDWLQDVRQDSAATITRNALSGAEALCVETLDWFTRLYGAEAGNLALKMKATGGVYLGGGIAPKILTALQGGGFLEAFLDKGRMRGLVESMPVHVICTEQVSLRGLAHFAALQG